ncbi:hypothetical protein [uncultured Gammaproteobacteria bacterium]|nr:hypothetical protein [uncultured Gammaproteobacteria bacterium]
MMLIIVIKWIMNTRGCDCLLCFHPTGKAVFWLKPLYQLGFVFFLISIFGLGNGLSVVYLFFG